MADVSNRGWRHARLDPDARPFSDEQSCYRVELVVRGRAYWPTVVAHDSDEALRIAAEVMGEALAMDTSWEPVASEAIGVPQLLHALSNHESGGSALMRRRRAARLAAAS